MSYIFEFIEGPEMGKKITVKAGDTFGRSRATYLLNDPKVSGLHAEIKVSENGMLLLVDRGSANGIKFENQRVRLLTLADGMKFVLGKSTILVRSLNSQSKGKISSSTNDYQPGAQESYAKPPTEFEKIATADKKKEIERLPWDAFLKKSIKKLSLSNADESSVEISHFKKVLTLTFKQGPDAEKEFLLGYGPRYFGFQCLDFELSDTSLPELAFTIAPDKDKNPVITKLNDFPILLNGNKFSSEKLINNDLVEFGQNIFVVRIEETK